MTTDVALGSDEIAIQRDGEPGDIPDNRWDAPPPWEEPSKDLEVVDDPPQTKTEPEQAAPGIDLPTASKADLYDYARKHYGVSLDVTRRVDFLRNEVRRLVARGKSSAAAPVPLSAAAYLRNTKTGLVFEATDFLRKYGDDLEPCDADGNPL